MVVTHGLHFNDQHADWRSNFCKKWKTGVCVCKYSTRFSDGFRFDFLARGWCFDVSNPHFESVGVDGLLTTRCLVEDTESKSVKDTGVEYTHKKMKISG